MRTPRMFRRSIPTAAAVLAVVGASACSPATSGSPEPTDQAPVTTSSSAPAVTIDNPKNLKAVKDTCSLLNQQQLTKLGLQVKPTRSQSEFGSTRCDWSGEEFAVTITPDTTSGGMKHLYQAYKPGQGLQKSEVKGYPAARLNKTTRLCRIEVGVAKGAKFAISYASYKSDSEGPHKPCQNGEKIAAMVLENIPDA